MKHVLLTKLNACSEAVTWASQYKTLQAAWDDCPRGDWMLWLAGRLSGWAGSVARRKLMLATTECARLAWPYVHDQDRTVVQKCYETAEAYGRGEPGVTLDNVRTAANVDTTIAAAAFAADHVATAAAAPTAAGAGNAAAAICTYVAAAFQTTARLSALSLCAAIVRKHYPDLPRRSRAW